jgi:alpha-beta hydrolase superfamily lysophospholipase
VELTPRLIPVAVPDDPEGLVVVLHGGAKRGETLMVSPAQLSVLRMIPIARRIARAGRHRLAVFRLLNARRGWDTAHTPVDDTRWALQQLFGRFSRSLPCCLVGHSLGGRAALLAAGEPEVHSAVALAPWVQPSDRPEGVRGKPILIIHGSWDRVADPAKAAELARRLQDRDGAQVDFRLIRGATHAMLARHDSFSAPAAQFAVATLRRR